MSKSSNRRHRLAAKHLRSLLAANPRIFDNIDRDAMLRITAENLGIPHSAFATKEQVRLRRARRGAALKGWATRRESLKRADFDRAWREQCKNLVPHTQNRRWQPCEVPLGMGRK